MGAEIPIDPTLGGVTRHSGGTEVMSLASQPDEFVRISVIV